MKLINILFISLLLCFANSILAETMKDKAKNSFDSVKGKFNSKKALNANYAQPLMTDNVDMKTLNGQSTFSGRVGCKSDNNYLTVGVNINSVGNVTAFVSADSNLDGSIDQNTSFNDISVVCANGFQQCTNGAKDCDTFKWNSSPIITAQKMITDAEIASVHSCYCVNNACSPNLAVNNKDDIVRTLGNGIASAMQQFNPYYTISDVRNVAGTLDFYGQDTVSCNTNTTPQLHAYKNNSNQLSADGNSATSDAKYVMVENLISQTGNSGNLFNCAISRNFSHVKVTQADILSFDSGQGSLHSCGANCLELTVGIDANDTFDVGASCVITNIHTRLKVDIPDKIISATLVEATFEEDLNLSTDVGGVIATHNGLPINPIASQSCTGDRSSRNSYGGYDITNHFKQQGYVNIKGALASYRGASYYYKIRFIIDSEVERANRFRVFAQGRNFIQCDYSLAAGTTSCNTDASVYTADVSTTWDVNELCGTETTISRTSDSNYFPSIGSGNLDTTVNIYNIKTPTCANGLTGTFRIEDKTSSSSTSAYLSQNIYFTLKKPTCDLVETVNNLCTSYEGRCPIEKEVVDGVTTINNMISTGLFPLPSSKFINGDACSSNVTRDYFLKKRTYRCESTTSPITIDTSRFIKPVVSGNNVSINMANTGNGSSSVNIPMPDLPTANACIQTCEVRSAETDTRVNLSGVVSEGRNNNTTYKKSYRSCEAGVCPVESGEQIIQACGCLNEFGKAMTMMQLIRLAGKDMICTDGNQTSGQP